MHKTVRCLRGRMREAPFRRGGFVKGRLRLVDRNRIIMRHFRMWADHTFHMHHHLHSTISPQALLHWQTSSRRPGLAQSHCTRSRQLVERSAAIRIQDMYVSVQPLRRVREKRWPKPKDCYSKVGSVSIRGAIQQSQTTRRMYPHHSPTGWRPREASTGVLAESLR